MNIKLSNGTTMAPILITGEIRYVQGGQPGHAEFHLPG